jgi:hypothetical protein
MTRRTDGEEFCGFHGVQTLQELMRLNRENSKARGKWENMV